MKYMKVFILVALVLSSTACKKWWGKDDDDSYNPFQGVSAEVLYSESKKAMAKEQYSSAIQRLEALETMYPFNDHAEKAELMLIYAYYKKGDNASTAATAERFIRLYPRSERVDYAYYMKGLANFQQNRGTMSHLLKIDESWRDPGTQSQAYSDFATLVQKFPDSKYKPNALQRMIYLRNEFAKRELNAATYYYERGRFVAAAERASFVVKTYPQSPSVKKALIVLYQADQQLGLESAANDAAAIYKATFHTPLVIRAAS